MESLPSSQTKAQFLATDNSKIAEITKFKIGLCQLSVSADKKTNIARARSSIQIAANRGAKLVVLPEMWNCPYSSRYFGDFSEDLEDKDCSPSLSMLSEAALDHGITIVGGSIPERRSGRLYNTCFVFGPDGKLKAKQRKMHMFDVDIPGDIVFKESDTFTAGDRLTIVNTDIGSIGIGICHDIRFPELAMLYRAQGADLLCYPGAFNMSTGEALWELEQRARAADNQLFVATCSPSRDSVGDYMIWGHSTIVGPSGEIIASSSYKETVVVAEIDYSAIHHERCAHPLRTQRHENMYQFVSVNTNSP